MNKTKGLFFTASLVLALTLTQSCSGDDGGGGGGDPSSSSGGETQGGGDPSSSSNGGQGGGSNCTADFGEVQIGSQTWAKKNLDCDVAGSECYDDDPANCTKYGRLYNWEAAMTACPSGWHLPTKAEWEVLGDDETKLKATSGWDFGIANGTDDYGFSALPGAYYSIGYPPGYVSYWWSASNNNESSEYAYARRIVYSIQGVTWTDDLTKYYMLSVRCIKD